MFYYRADEDVVKQQLVYADASSYFSYLKL